jgi:hypothetical protein
MDIQDLKIYALNAVSLAVSFTNIELILRILLISISIGYTIAKWYKLNDNNDLSKNK